MKLVIEIPEEDYKLYAYDEWNLPLGLVDALQNGKQLPKSGFIAICNSDLPITKEVVDHLTSTIFVGDEDVTYCFEITEIIEADKEGAE